MTINKVMLTSTIVNDIDDGDTYYTDLEFIFIDKELRDKYINMFSNQLDDDVIDSSELSVYNNYSFSYDNITLADHHGYTLHLDRILKARCLKSAVLNMNNENYDIQMICKFIILTRGEYEYRMYYI